ncbi:MAG: ATP-binding protein [Lachnospiraceae bacterium]|nr:ATP-binding protein [Lachnospiraceae bacterium]
MRRKIEQELLIWKQKKSDRKPLLLYGARQVGKTYILMDFGEKNYENVVYVNLETNLSVASIFDEDIRPERIMKLLEAVVGEQINPETTLLFLDEIQSCERALTSLKYFCEQAPEYHIVAAGSLLGVAVNRKRYSFPVGKVHSLSLYPLDFEEFMWALGEDGLIDEIRTAYDKKQALPEALHKKALELYHYYLIVGGMPTAVKEYTDRGRLVLVPNVQNEILNNYVADMAKYASQEETVKIRAAFNSVPAQLAKDNKKFQYKVIQRGASSSMFGVSIDWLEQAGIVIKCRKIEQGCAPISVYENLSSFKLYMSDVGLLVAKSGLSQRIILLNEANTFMGAVTENYIGQQLASTGSQIYYWAPENSQAELDFVIQKDGDVIAIESKRSTHNKSRSLGMFINKYKPRRAIRLSEENFYCTNSVEAVPLYALFCL